MAVRKKGKTMSMNSQFTHKRSLPIGIDLDDDVTVKIWQDGSVTFIQYGEKGDQDEVIISKEGLVKLFEWLNKHAVEQPLAPDAATIAAQSGDDETIWGADDLGDA